MNKREIGSKTAKGGFANEKSICMKFNNWQEDKVAQDWLKIMGYSIDTLSSVKAIQIPTRIKKSDLREFEIDEKEYNELIRFKKSDAQIRIMIKVGGILRIENLSLKKANSNADYNQVDKRTVDDYKEMWRFDNDISLWLRLFTGELNPKSHSNLLDTQKLRDERRLFIDEMPKEIQDKILDFFKTNRIMIVSDILKGRGGLSADWMLVTRYHIDENTTTWTLKDINTAMNFFGGGDIVVSPKGSIYIGKITVQRKGGTPDPNKLQFKIKPCDLFKLENYGS
ncbi:MAG: hypothetical protein N3A62_03595 [Thermodesulfovibrionales bacterium]|nr:hypothetical protein [Thermodesulfovibrionales bacterium]